MLGRCAGCGGSQSIGIGRLGRARIGTRPLPTIECCAPPIIRGGLDRELVRRVIRSHESQIRACYEERLLANPALEGKVSLQFSIGESGEVLAAAVDRDVTGLDDAALHACMASRVRSWLFPKPRAGGVTVVTYPWVFHAAGR
jgi:hypothetical protein